MADVAAAAPPEVLADGRRGTGSLRESLGKAFEEATFPPYPAAALAEEEVAFGLPPGFVDKDAPDSARKW